MVWNGDILVEYALAGVVVLLDWFWNESAAGLLLVKVRDIGLASSDRAIRETAANHLVPRAYFARFAIKDLASPSTAATDPKFGD